MNIKPGIYTESNSNLNLSLVEAMLTRPDPSRLVSAPVLNPQPFQVYLLSVPAHNTSSECVCVLTWLVYSAMTFLYIIHSFPCSLYSLRTCTFPYITFFLQVIAGI